MTYDMHKKVMDVLEKYGFPYNVGYAAQRQWIADNSHRFAADLLAIKGFGRARLSELAGSYNLKVTYKFSM